MRIPPETAAAVGALVASVGRRIDAARAAVPARLLYRGSHRIQLDAGEFAWSWSALDSLPSAFRGWRLPALLVSVVAIVASVAAIPSSPPPDPGEAVAALARVVERIRGITFVRRPPVRVVTAAEYTRGLAETAAAAREQGARVGEMMQAIGLLAPDANLVDLMARARAGTGFARYDMYTGELLLRDARLTPYRRSVLVHELAFALDVQRATLHRPGPAATYDSAAWPVLALFEGDARRIENVYRASMSHLERRTADREQAGHDHQRRRGLPRTVTELTAAPSLRGQRLVRAILDEGGQAALDRAFANPPTTAQQALYPDLYLAGVTAVPVVAAPSPEPLSSGVFGAFLLQQILAEDPATADWAARAWAGDSVTTWVDRGGFCAAITFALRDTSALRRFEHVLRRWAVSRPKGAVQRRDGVVVVTSCSLTDEAAAAREAAGSPPGEERPRWIPIPEPTKRPPTGAGRGPFL